MKVLWSASAEARCVDDTEPRPLGDAPSRSYAGKLEQFARFAEPELRRIIDDLPINGSSRILDAGCGVGLTTRWLADRAGFVVGFDLSTAHVERAHDLGGTVVQADMMQPCFRPESFDAVWCCNTINHAENPIAALHALRKVARADSPIMLVQSSLLPEMYFAWDARLEDSVRQACYTYYRDKYGLSAEVTTGVRALAGLMKGAGLGEVAVHTHILERVQPLSEADRAYFTETVFNGYWGEKIRPYMPEADWLQLERLCNPASSAFCLDRSDFHHIQTLTVVTGRA